MHDFIELDRVFNSNTAEKYHVSIQLKPDGFSFCILDYYLKKYVGIKHIHFREALDDNTLVPKLKQIFNTEPLLQHKYAGMSLMTVTKKSLLVPDKLFKKEDAASYFSVTGQLEEYDEIHYNQVQAAGAVALFAVNHEVLNVFRHFISGLKVYHHWTPLIHTALQNTDSHKASMYIHFNNHSTDLVCVHENRLLFCNAFEVPDDNDFVFYVLNVLKKLDIEHSQCALILTGHINQRAKGIDLLGRFVQNVKVAGLTENFSFSRSLKNISRPDFYNLYNLYHCVLSEAPSGAEN